MKLTEKQKRFADFYVESGNATQAAIKAGYSEKYANTNASKLLQNTTLKSYIEMQLEKMQNERTADAQEVLEFLTSVMRGEKTEQLMRLDGDGVQVIDDVDLQGKDRIKAAELLGKRYALFTDKKEVEINDVTFVDDVPIGDKDD
jgi:phage terminase small subunit